MGLRRFDRPRSGITQESVSDQRLSSVLGKRGEPLQGRKIIYSDSRVHGNRTTWRCASTYYNYNSDLIKMNVGSEIASSQDVEGESPGVVIY